MKNKIIKLNEAYNKIRAGIVTIKVIFKSVKEVIKIVNEIDRQHTKLSRTILKQLKKEQMDKDWNKLVIKLKKETNHDNG